MKFIIFFIYVSFIHSESYMLTTTYSNGQTIAGTPEVSTVTTLDLEQIDYYDGVTKKLIPKQDWMKEFASGDSWKEYTEFRERVQQTNKINITALMQRFNQTPGVHTFQRVYGCFWNETPDSIGFDEYSYDGEHFISLDLKELRYTASVPQAKLTVQKWNKDRKQRNILKKYYDYECVYWLKELLHFSKATSKKMGIVPELAGQSLIEPTQKIGNHTKSTGSELDALYFILPVSILLLVIFLTICYHWNHLKRYYDKLYYKDVHSDAQNPITEPLQINSSSPVEGSSQRYPRNETFEK